MRVLITGADGFIAKNIKVALAERKDIEVLRFSRANQSFELIEMLKKADFIFHFAGVNRTQDIEEFTRGNRDLTHMICETLSTLHRKIPILFTSSTQATLMNFYGVSKREAEDVLRDFAHNYDSPVYIYRLPNVFGKWSNPNYNSVVATFCHNIARDLPIHINDPAAEISLVYIDDVVKQFIRVMDGHISDQIVEPVYTTTVGALAHQIQLFRDSRNTLVTEAVGIGFIRALYSTYVSFLLPQDFSYPLLKHEDPRGIFVEMLKTSNAGQFSFFTAYPKVTRGGHYHHTKTEKFLVIKGHARFCFRHMITNESYTLFTRGEQPTVVETAPGWTHDITNVGSEEMIVMLWANEIFDHQCPDTYISPV